jgi:hypothetical protein
MLAFEFIQVIANILVELAKLIILNLQTLHLLTTCSTKQTSFQYQTEPSSVVP